jgi:hypothetical protein
MGVCITWRHAAGEQLDAFCGWTEMAPIASI